MTRRKLETPGQLGLNRAISGYKVKLLGGNPLKTAAGARLEHLIAKCALRSPSEGRKQMFQMTEAYEWAIITLSQRFVKWRFSGIPSS